MKKVLLYPGSFDPIHEGHIRLAKTAYEEIEADKIRFCLQPNLYKDEGMFTIRQRLQFMKHKFSQYMEKYNIELDTPCTSFFVEYLRSLPERELSTDDNPGEIIKYFLIVGSDTLNVMERWNDYKEVISRVTLLVTIREGDTRISTYEMLNKLGSLHWITFGKPEERITKMSSTNIRKTIEGFVNDGDV